MAAALNKIMHATLHSTVLKFHMLHLALGEAHNLCDTPHTSLLQLQMVCFMIMATVMPLSAAATRSTASRV